MNILALSGANRGAPSQLSRRAALGLALGAVLGGVGVPVSHAAAAKTRLKRPRRRPTRRRHRRPRYKVLTRTFHSTSAIVINDVGPASPYPSLLTVAGLKHGRLLDLNVRLSGFSHTYVADVDLLLVAPNGRSAVIVSDIVGSRFEASNLTLVLDDQAALPLPASPPIGSGHYQPRNHGTDNPEDDVFPSWPGGTSPNVALATFNGINPNGTWKLYLVDDGSSDLGSITGWALTMKARVRV